MARRCLESRISRIYDPMMWKKENMRLHAQGRREREREREIEIDRDKERARTMTNPLKHNYLRRGKGRGCAGSHGSWQHMRTSFAVTCSLATECSLRTSTPAAVTCRPHLFRPHSVHLCLASAFRRLRSRCSCALKLGRLRVGAERPETLASAADMSPPRGLHIRRPARKATGTPLGIGPQGGGAPATHA